jgi:hypothetical protein
VSRVNAAGLLELASALGASERTVVDIITKLRLASHAQLIALVGSSAADRSTASAARTVRRTLARLTTLGVLARLDRRVGGVRAGSAGYVYYLGPVGQRLVAYWEGRGLIRGRYRPEPGGRYVRHRLAVSELYVKLHAADRAGELDLLAFDAEPDCWRHHLDGFGGSAMLKPDAFVRLGIGAYEDRCFVEVDLGTESRSVIAAKLRTYLDYFHGGAEQAEHGVFPRVVVLTDSETRRDALVDVAAKLPAEHWSLFVVGTLDLALDAMTGRVAAAGELAEDHGVRA